MPIDLNGTDLMNHPWNTTLMHFTNFFENTTGVGETLWLFILIILTFAVFVKSERHPLYTMLFLACGSATLSVGGIFQGAPIMTTVFTILTGIALAGMFISLYFQRR